MKGQEVSAQFGGGEKDENHQKCCGFFFEEEIKLMLREILLGGCFGFFFFFSKINWLGRWGETKNTGRLGGGWRSGRGRGCAG